MRKRILCIFLIIVTLSLMLLGCEKEYESTDKLVITEEGFKVGALLPSKETASKNVEAGLNYAYSLASSINLNESLDMKLEVLYYTDSGDVSNFAESLVNDGASAIVFYSEDLESSNIFFKYIAKTGIPVISLGPYTSEYKNIYTLSLSPKYMSSCAATYALEKGYKKCAVLLSDSEKYYTDFAEAYRTTLKSYIGFEPTVYYKKGELANYSPSALASGNYEYVFLIEPPYDREEAVNELRNNGFVGEIMLTEVFDKASVKNIDFNNCSFISKLEVDSGNSVSTVFYSAFSEFNGVKEADVSAASAYGYDAYMAIFEALKSFVPKSTGSIFANNFSVEESSVVNHTEIKLSDLCDAVNNVKYYGVSDVITFNNKVTMSTYIYVDNIINADILFGSKYTFAAE